MRHEGEGGKKGVGGNGFWGKPRKMSKKGGNSFQGRYGPLGSSATRVPGARRRLGRRSQQARVADYTEKRLCPRATARDNHLRLARTGRLREARRRLRRDARHFLAQAYTDAMASRDG